MANSPRSGGSRPGTPQRQSPAVYRRRRLVAIVALLLVVAVIAVVVIALSAGRGAQPGAAPPSGASSGAAEAPQPTTTAVEPTPTETRTSLPTSFAPDPVQPTDGSTPGSTPTATETAPAAPVECTSQSMLVEALVSSGTFDAATLPRFSVRLTNVGTAPCLVNAGTAQQDFIVTSGTDRIWSSADCRVNPADSVIELQPQTPVTSPEFDWPRTRSTPDTCGQPDRPTAVGGGSTYRLSVSVAGVESREQAVFILQ